MESARLLEINDKFAEMSVISELALWYEEKINEEGLSSEQRESLIGTAIKELDDLAEPIYFKKEVELTGICFIPTIEKQGMDVHIRQDQQYTSVKGISNGFMYANFVVEDSSEKELPKPRVVLLHQIVIGSFSDFSPSGQINGWLAVTAPVRDSQIELVEDKNLRERLVLADQITEDEAGSELCEDLEMLLYETPEKFKFSELGKLIGKVALTMPDKLDQYLDYTANILELPGQMVQVEAKLIEIIDPTSNGKAMVRINPGLIYGKCEGLCMRQQYKLRPNKRLALIQETEGVSIALRSIPMGETEEHLVYVPLESITQLDLQ